MKFSKSHHALVASVTEGTGHATSELRRSVFDYARSLCVNAEADNPLQGTLAKWAEKVARYAYKTLPSDVDAMKGDGKSEDEIFELTIASALGAATGRYERAVESIEQGYDP